jgi:hypothetical protein
MDPAKFLPDDRNESVSTMLFVRVTRKAIVPVWFVVFGLVVLVWSPLTVAMGALLLLVGLAAPAAFLLWKGR